MREILDVRWFCGVTNVGIVKVLDEYEGIKYYIAAIEGMDEDHDKEILTDWGSTFPNDAGDVLFGVANALAVDHLPVPNSREHAENMVRLGQFYLANSEESA